MSFAGLDRHLRGRFCGPEPSFIAQAGFTWTFRTRSASLVCCNRNTALLHDDPHMLR
jgi:hypothetical protein